MSGNILQFLILAVCFLAAGVVVVRYNSARQGSVAWAAPAAWIAFILSAASAIAAVFMAVLCQFVS
jgi:hypothetical protein